jgi:hypothetical protein
MGILSDHVPSITQLKPGVVEVIVDGTSGDKWFGIYPIESFAYCVLQSVGDSLLFNPGIYFR